MEREQRVQGDLERVDGELELAAHRVHEFQFDGLVTARVSEGDEGPAVAVGVDADHLGDVGLLHAGGVGAAARRGGREEGGEVAEHGGLDAVAVARGGQLGGEDEVDVGVGLRAVGEHVAGGAAVEAHVAHGHAGAARAHGGLEARAHVGHELAQAHVQRGEVAAPVDGHHLVHHVVQSPHLLVAEHRVPLAAAAALLR